MGLFLAALIGLILLARKGGAERSGSRPESIALIGDSLAVGLRAPLAALAASHGVTFTADVRGGTNAGQWLSNWTRHVLEKHPSALLISLGTNDSAVPGNSPLFIERARRLVEMADDYGAAVFWLMPPPMPWSLADVERGIAESGGARIDPPEDLKRAPDKIHASGSGYTAWAEAIWSDLYG